MPDDERFPLEKGGETCLYRFSAEELNAILKLARIGKSAAAEAMPIDKSYRFLKFDVDGLEESLSMQEVRTALDLAETIKLQSLPPKPTREVSREDLNTYYDSRPFTPWYEWPLRILLPWTTYQREYRTKRRSPRALPSMARPLYKFVTLFFDDIRKTICEGKSGNNSLSHTTTGGAVALSAWLIHGFGVTAVAAEATSAAIIVATLAAAKASFCQLTAEQAKEAVAREAKLKKKASKKIASTSVPDNQHI